MKSEGQTTLRAPLLEKVRGHVPTLPPWFRICLQT